MSERNVIRFASRNVVETANKKIVGTIKARSYKICASPHDLAQYARTTKACLSARLSFSLIAGAADSLGDRVERQEVDVPIQNDWQNQDGEVVETEDGNKILGWQARGEKALTLPQLSSSVPTPAEITGREIISISQLTNPSSTQQQTEVDVLEGISVEPKTPVSLQNYRSNKADDRLDTERANSIFFQPINDSQKAA